VAQVLVSQFQIDKGRLSSSGKGETEPVDDNTTEKGRANNRRVEFVKM
jgi:flagellar motor protein MotB